MTIYKYLKLKYNKKIVDKIFDSNNDFDSSKKMGIVGTRGCGTTTIQALEIVLSDIVFGLKYRVMTDCQFQGALYSEKDFDQKLIINVDSDHERESIELLKYNILKSINYSEINNE